MRNSLSKRTWTRGGTTRLGNSTRLESTLISSFNSSLTRLVHQLENSQLDSTRFLISKLDNSTSDSNANTLPKILKFTIYKMKYASLIFIFSYFLQVLMIFFHVTQYLCMLKAPILKIIKKLPKNRNLKLDSKLKNSNSNRLDWKFPQLILSLTRLDPKIYQLDSTRFDKFSTRSTPSVDHCCFWMVIFHL